MTSHSNIESYRFIQDVIYWLDNPRSAHYETKPYGHSFNTDAFCKEKAAELDANINQKIVSELEAVVIKGGCGCLTCDALKDRIAALRPNIPREERDA